MVRLGIAGAEVNQIAIHEARATRGIVRPDFDPGQQVVSPEDIGVGRAELDRRPRPQLADRAILADLQFVLQRHGQILGLVHERALIAVVQTIRVEAQNFAMAGHRVNALAIDGRRRADSQLMIVGLALHFGNDQLPEELAGRFVEAHQDVLVAGVFRIARRVVVRADEHFTARDHRIAVGVRAELDRPLHATRFRVGVGRRIKPHRANPFASDTIFRSSVPPHCGQSWATHGEEVEPSATMAQKHPHVSKETTRIRQLASRKRLILQTGMRRRAASAGFSKRQAGRREFKEGRTFAVT